MRASSGAAAPAPARPIPIRVRRARPTDAAAIGMLTAEAFEPPLLAAARSPGRPYGALAASLAATLLARSAEAGASRVRAWAAAAAEAKGLVQAHQARHAFPSRRAARRAARAAAAAARARRTVVLVAEAVEEGGGGGAAPSPCPPPPPLLGAAALLRVRVGAALPPPFPTAAPAVAYVADLAVAPAARGGGIASALLERAARRACLWGDPALWLHAPARRRTLYARAGFGPAHGGTGGEDETGGGGGGGDGGRRVLLVRQLAPPARRRGGGAGAGGGAGVYVWEE